MRVVFRVDASLEMGTGHVMRCLALAQALKTKGVEVIFVCRQHPGNLICKIQKNGFHVYELPPPLFDGKLDDRLPHASWLGVTQEQDANECTAFLSSIETDWLIVDHYALDKEWQHQLQSYCQQIMVIDDLADRHHWCDLLLDQTFERRSDDYLTLVPKKCRLLLGSQYALLRPEFSEWRGYSLKRRSLLEFKQLLVNMGGVDLNNVTSKILQQLKTCNLPHDINIIVVMGGYSPGLKEVQALADEMPYQTKVSIDVDNMAELMSNSDLAIGASGATTWERCCLGLPTIQMVIAENQHTIAKRMSEKGSVQLCKDVNTLPYLINNAENWMDIVSRNCQHIIDGTGVFQVVDVLIGAKA